MRSLIILFNCFLLASSSLIERFEDWASKHDIHFLDDAEKEHVLRKWKLNDEFIEATNAKNLSYTVGHNQFSGMDSDEFSEYLGFVNQEPKDEGLLTFHPFHFQGKIQTAKCVMDCVKGLQDECYTDTVKCIKGCKQGDIGSLAVPESVDWVKKGAVTPVKNQGQCGSCWSFSTTGALEGAYFNANGKLDSFSEQQLVDCDNRQNGGKDMGCNGGLMDNAFTWIKKNGGLCTEEDYPYVSGTTRTSGTCQTTCSLVQGSDITSFYDVPPSSDEDMMLALSKQPVSIAIQADQQSFQLYKSGVFTGSCGTKLDHGVLAVGYGSLNGEDYYLVKNSWGTSWGQNGYIMLGRGDEYNNGNGQCGMLMQGSYPSV